MFCQCMKNPAVGRKYSLLKKPGTPGSAVGMRYYSTEKKPEKILENAKSFKIGNIEAGFGPG
ncbi:hypothetical protein Hanom_Chr08g00713381 [Helianthus anomalus]